jgi:acyl carrier protein
MTIQQELRTHIQRTYLPDTPAEQLSDDIDLLATGVIDSLQVLRLVAWLEEHYQIPVGDSDVGLEDLRSITSLSGLVQRERQLRREK